MKWYLIAGLVIAGIILQGAGYQGFNQGPGNMPVYYALNQHNGEQGQQQQGQQGQTNPPARQGAGGMPGCANITVSGQQQLPGGGAVAWQINNQGIVAQIALPWGSIGVGQGQQPARQG